MTATTTEPKTLTARQREILEYVCDFQVKNGFPPTVRELKLAFDIASPNGIVCHLRAMLKKGYLDSRTYRKRALRVLAPPGPGWIAFPGGVWLRRANAVEAQRDLMRQLIESAADGPSLAENLEHKEN